MRRGRAWENCSSLKAKPFGIVGAMEAELVWQEGKGRGREGVRQPLDLTQKGLDSFVASESRTMETSVGREPVL